MLSKNQLQFQIKILRNYLWDEARYLQNGRAKKFIQNILVLNAVRDAWYIITL